MTATLSIYRYDTTKTATTEGNVVTPTGVLQIRIIESANGRKREVFAGFDLVDTTLWDDDTVTEHKYFRASEKAVHKWAGSNPVQNQPTNAQDVVTTLGIEKELTGRVQECIEAAFGFAPPPETAAQREAREKQQWAQAHMAAEERIANDPTYGIF